MFRNAFRSAQAAVGASQPSPSPQAPTAPVPTSPSTNRGDDTVNYSVNGSFDDDSLSSERLPFGKRGGSRGIGGGDASMMSEASAASGGKRSLKEAKQGMMLQIMGGQAMVEAKGYTVLDFDDMERLKQVGYHSLASGRRR